VAERLLPPRAAFVPYPLGRVCGHPFTPNEQRAIVRDTLSLLATAQAPGQIVDLPYSW